VASLSVASIALLPRLSVFCIDMKQRASSSEGERERERERERDQDKLSVSLFVFLVALSSEGYRVRDAKRDAERERERERDKLAAGDRQRHALPVREEHEERTNENRVLSSLMNHRVVAGRLRSTPDSNPNHRLPSPTIPFRI
jgi:hypothetical protein